MQISHWHDVVSKLSRITQGGAMEKGAILIFSLFILLLVPGAARGHFGMMIPSDSMILQGEDRTVTLELSFSHPFDGQGMEMDMPKTFGVLINGKRQNLLENLNQTRIMEHMAWSIQFNIKRPGVYIFYMEPQPYWESAEDTFIVHYTKTVVTAFGDDEGWDQEVGLKTFWPVCGQRIPGYRPIGRKICSVC